MKVRLGQYRKRVQILVLCSIPFLFFLISAELVLRATHLFGARLSWAEPHDKWGWRHSPGMEYFYLGEDNVPITGHINRFGWRDRDRSLAKPSNTYRIAVLGDSLIEAFTVDEDSTFCAITEACLAQEANAIEVMNFGRSGMTQSEQYLVLKDEVFRFDPDMVILFFLPSNDIRDVSRKTAPFLLRPFFTVSDNNRLILDDSFLTTSEFQIKNWINPLKQRSILVSLLAERFNALRQMYRFKQTHQGTLAFTTKAKQVKFHKYLSLATDFPDSIYAENYKLNKRLIREMVALCKDADVDFMLTCAPTVFKPEEVVAYQQVEPTFNSVFFEQELKALADTLDIDFLSLHDQFESFYHQTSSPVLNDGHWNHKGHRLIADVLCDYLVNIKGRDARVEWR